jgi:predicted CXXCH cytochrome family protein
MLRVIVSVAVVTVLSLTGCKTLNSGGIVVPAPDVKGAEFVGMETCATCHEKTVKDFKKTAHARLVVASEEIKDQGCEACHGAGSLHVDAQTPADKKATIVNPGKSPEACFKCHLEKKAEFSLQYHHPVPEGKMTCTDCHNPHSSDGVKPGSGKSLFGKNELCARCHKPESGPFVYEHEATREGCTVCHNVHGSINDKMLIERDANLCLKCHTQSNFPFMGHNDHTDDYWRGPCFSGGCHNAVHGSNYNDHLRI